MTYIIRATTEAVQAFIDFTGLEVHINPVNTMIDAQLVRVESLQPPAGLVYHLPFRYNRRDL